MPLKYGINPLTPPNPCMECGDRCRRPKRFCSDSHHELWITGRGLVIDQRGAEQVAAQRKQRGITPESLDWRRKLNVSKPF